MPANTIDINIGSFDLDSNNNIAISDINIRVAKALSQADLVKSAGSIIPKAKRRNIMIDIKGTVKGSNYDNFRSNLDALKAAFESDSEQRLTIDDDRFVNVQYSGFGCAFMNMRTIASFSFSLIASDPFWYSLTLSSDSRTPTSGVSYNITVGGNAPTRAKVTFTKIGIGSVSDNLKFQNLTTVETLQYRGILASGDSLIVNNRVDQDTISIENDSVSDKANFEGDLITLQPGVNSLKYTGTSGVQVAIQYREANY